MTISRSDVQQRKASLPIRWTFGGSQMSTRATQYAKVEPQMAVVSRAHQVNLNESLTVLTRFWADEVEVWWKAEAFDASSTEAAVWEGP